MVSWFEENAYENFNNVLKPLFVDKPIGYLEIGVYEGTSAKWVAENILTHPDSYAHLVDPWTAFRHTRGSKMVRHYRNLVKHFRDRPNIQIFRMESVHYCHQTKQLFDLIYIDGEHTMPAVVTDMTGTWPMLKIGGVMVLDDYVDRNRRHVLHGVALFAEVFGHNIDTLFTTKKQVAFRKKSRVRACELC